MNLKAKGNNAQREFAKYLQSRGFQTEIKTNTKFKHGDFFGIADIIATSKTMWLLVQVKSNSTCGALKLLKDRIPDFPKHTKFVVVVRYDGNSKVQPHWKIYDLNTGNVCQMDIPKDL